ncbi:hypothetical protein [Paracoccus jeotgali]|uniref:hypothetical protein n=1 Tax=Paracoccus jeotgali TaxID=2065379 RepID=UPI0028AE8400|nr:hypothetical protein [Paracoccus jeotgali]
MTAEPPLSPASAAAPGPRRIASGALLTAAVLSLSSCGPRNTDETLRGGVPARTNLPLATGLPPDAVRTVSRRDYGWRLIYLPALSPADAEGRAASALCRLERRGVGRIEQIPQVAPQDDPGTRMIDIHCA